LRLEVSGNQRVADHSLTLAQLGEEKRMVEIKLMHARSQLEDMRASCKVKEDIFKSNKGYEE
jgi:hypothetical protein